MGAIGSFLIKNCFYSDDFDFKVRSFRSGRVVDKYQFTYKVAPGAISTVNVPGGFYFELRSPVS